MIRAAAPPVHLDTSFLIRALGPGTAEAARLREWLEERRSVAVCALAWGEFLCGPVTEAESALARRIVRTHVPIRTQEATEAARLFNVGGRRRGSFADCLIAAAAMIARAELATSNPDDFGPFLADGLMLAARTQDSP